MASPSFSINSGTVDEKVSVAAASPVVATLDSIVGVRTVSWELTRTDETTTPASYTLTPSGSVGQTVSTTSLGVGTAGVLKATINGGQTNDVVDPGTSQEVKFYVPLADGGEVLCAGETDSSAASPDRVASPTHGAVEPINAAIRAASVAPDFTVATLPAVSLTNMWIHVTDETGGPIMAYSDGTNWRRISDDAIVS